MTEEVPAAAEEAPEADAPSQRDTDDTAEPAGPAEAADSAGAEADAQAEPEGDAAAAEPAPATAVAPSTTQTDSQADAPDEQPDEQPAAGEGDEEPADEAGEAQPAHDDGAILEEYEDDGGEGASSEEGSGDGLAEDAGAAPPEPSKPLVSFRRGHFQLPCVCDAPETRPFHFARLGLTIDIPRILRDASASPWSLMRCPPQAPSSCMTTDMVARRAKPGKFMLRCAVGRASALARCQQAYCLQCWTAGRCAVVNMPRSHPCFLSTNAGGRQGSRKSCGALWMTCGCMTSSRR